MIAKSRYLIVLFALSVAYAGYAWLSPKAISMRIVSSSCRDIACNYELILESESSIPVDVELRMLAFGIPSAVAPTQTYRTSRSLHLLPNETISVSGTVDVHFIPASLEVTLHKWQELK